jgi:hypothetical protein
MSAWVLTGRLCRLMAATIRSSSVGMGLVAWTLLAGCQAAVHDTAKATYEARCAQCHGDAGHGDGPLARKLPDSPTRFTAPGWRRSVDSVYVSRVIALGGSHVGISPLMPAAADIASDDRLLTELTEFVLELGK